MDASLLKAAFILAASGVIIFLAFPPTKVISKIIKSALRDKATKKAV